MSRLQELNAGRVNDTIPVHDPLTGKFIRTPHSGEVVGDHGLTLADKRALVASWASDVLAAEDRPSLRRSGNGAVIRVDDIMAALSSLDVDEFRDEKWLALSKSFARRPRRPTSRRRSLRLNDDDKLRRIRPAARYLGPSRSCSAACRSIPAGPRLSSAGGPAREALTGCGYCSATRPGVKIVAFTPCELNNSISRQMPTRPPNSPSSTASAAHSSAGVAALRQNPR
jgi:hypothetical protein